MVRAALFILLFAATGYAQLNLTSAFYPPVALKQSTAAPVASFFTETCQGAVAGVSGVVGTADNQWTGGAGGSKFNFDFSSTLTGGGTESLKVTVVGGDGFCYITSPLPSKSTVYGRGTFKATDLTGIPRLTMSLNGVADFFVMKLKGDGKMTCDHGTAGSGDSTITISTGTQYWFWFKYVKASSSMVQDGIFQCWVSTTKTKPGAPDTGMDDATGQAFLTADIISIQSNESGTCEWDLIELSDAPLGDFP